MVVADELLHVVDAFAHCPACVASVHVVDEHLQVFFGLRREGELESSVHGVAEFPNLCAGLAAGKGYRVFKEAVVLHLELLGTHEGVGLSLEAAVRSDWQLDVRGEGEVKR